MKHLPFPLTDTLLLQRQVPVFTALFTLQLVGADCEMDFTIEDADILKAGQARDETLYNSELQNSGGDVVDGLHSVRRYWLVAHGDCRCDVLTASTIPAPPSPPHVSAMHAFNHQIH
jgi:hypothetical protein